MAGESWFIPLGQETSRSKVSRGLLLLSSVFCLLGGRIENAGFAGFLGWRPPKVHGMEEGDEFSAVGRSRREDAIVVDMRDVTGAGVGAPGGITIVRAASCVADKTRGRGPAS